MVFIRILDSDVKAMVCNINDIKIRTKVIETKVNAIEKHLETQNGRLNKHSDEIKTLQVTDANFKGQASVLLLVGGGVGGLIGGVIMFLIQVFV